jgi:hypothetical protein
VATPSPTLLVYRWELARVSAQVRKSSRMTHLLALTGPANELGDITKTCGATLTANVFAVTSQNITKIANANTGLHVGCFADSPRGLPAYPWSSSTMTNELCTQGCKDMGYSLGGVEYGSQCFCDNAWRGGQQLPASSCNQVCSGEFQSIARSSEADTDDNIHRKF